MSYTQVPLRSFDDRAAGIIEARRRLGSDRIVELLWDDFPVNGSLASYATSSGTAARDSSTVANRDGIAQLRRGTASGNYGLVYWSGGQVASFLTMPWLVRARFKLSGTTQTGTTRTLVGLSNDGAVQDPSGAAIGAYGSGNTGGSDTKFSFAKADVGGGSYIGGTQFSADLDTNAHDAVIWYPGSGSTLYGSLDGEVVTLTTAGITAGRVGQAAATAHAGNATTTAQGMDLQFIHVLTTRP